MGGFRDKLERLAADPHATRWLFTIAAAEASILPVPSDILLLTLCVARPLRSMRFAAVCVAGSTAGAAAGYLIGATVFTGQAGTGLTAAFPDLAVVLARYRENAPVALLLAGFTPVPFALFSLAAGAGGTVPFATFLPAALAGRALRFFLVGGLMQVFGPRVRASLTGTLQLVAMVAGALMVAGYLAMHHLS